MLRLTLIVAATSSNGIGQHGSLPWRLPRELSYFSKATTTAPDGKINAVVMGRKAWESIPTKYRPLPKRVNVVISRNPDIVLEPSKDAPSYLHNSLVSALRYLNGSDLATKPLHKTFIIGGAFVYAEALALSPSSSQAFVDRVLMTRIISPEFDCDVFIPDFLNDAKEGANWKRASHNEFEEWVGFDVPKGIQNENGTQYEFQMWTREP